MDVQAALGLRNIDPKTWGSRAAKLEVGPFVKRKDGKPNSEMEQAVVLQRFVREVSGYLGFHQLCLCCKIVSGSLCVSGRSYVCVSLCESEGL